MYYRVQTNSVREQYVKYSSDLEFLNTVFDVLDFKYYTLFEYNLYLYIYCMNY